MCANLKGTVWTWRRELGPERPSHRCYGNRYILCRTACLIKTDVSMPGVKIALTCCNYMRRACRVIYFVERKCALSHRNIHGPWMLVPTGGGARHIIVCLHDHIDSRLRLRGVLKDGQSSD